MDNRYMHIYQKLQESFILVRSLHSDVIPNDGSVEVVKKDLPVMCSALRKNLSAEHMILIYCINMLLLILDEGNPEKIFDFADLIHNMPEIGMGKRDLTSFKDEIESFNEKYNSRYFVDCLNNGVDAGENKRELSESEKAYKRFDTISTFMLCFGLLLSFVFGALFLFTKSDEYKALWGCLLSINMVFYLFVPSKIDKKREMYLELLRKEREKTERAGLFKEIFDAHRQDCFEANLICDKWLYEEYHNNTIDIGIVRNNHEFLILFDEHTLSIVVDEETDHPTEDIVPLSHFTTIDEVIGFLNDYTYRHSNQEQTPDWFDKPDVEVLFEFNGT